MDLTRQDQLVVSTGVEVFRRKSGEVSLSDLCLHRRGGLPKAEFASRFLGQVSSLAWRSTVSIPSKSSDHAVISTRSWRSSGSEIFEVDLWMALHQRGG